MKIYVKLDVHTHITREGDPEDQWSGDDTESSWYIRGLSKAEPKDHDYRTVEVNYKPNSQTLYLVYAVYSTGDSFSHHESGSIELIDLYQTREEAEACITALGKIESYGENPITIITSSGNKLEYYVPWVGYFESLSDLEVMPLLW